MRFIFIILFFSIFSLVSAQQYKQYIGLRGGESTCISYKLFKSPVKALEANLAFRDGGVQAIVLIETYKPVYMKKSDRFFTYTGVGAHIGYTSSYRDKFRFNPIFNRAYFNRSFAPVVGLDVIAGIEYRFRNAPWIIAADFKPFFELFGSNYFTINIIDFGFSVKYEF